MPILTPVSHAELVSAVRILADRLGADSRWVPDHLVGVGRGGLVPAVYLSHATGLPMLSVDYSSQDKALAASAVAEIAERTRAGQNLLIVDDINDSGRTIARLTALLEGAGAFSSRVRFATLIDNSASAVRVSYAARTIDRAVTKDWFVFPWEAMAPGTAILADANEVPERVA